MVWNLILIKMTGVIGVLLFYAPPQMCWGSSTATVSCYHGGPLSGVIGFLKYELKDGFYSADDETLKVTGQGEYAGA